MNNNITALDLRQISNTEPPIIDYVLPSLPTGSVGLLSGAGGTGKSMLALQLGFVVSGANSGDLSFKREAWIKPKIGGKVVYISAEDGIPILHKRLYDISKYYKKIDQNAVEDAFDNFMIYPAAGVGFSLVNDNCEATTWYVHLRTACEGARLVFIDTMRRSHDLDENDNGKMSKFLKLIEQLATQTGAAIILLHHENKAGMNDKSAGSSALRGASAIVDNARWVARVRKMSEEDAKKMEVDEDRASYFLQFSIEKSNYGAPVKPIWLRRYEGGVLGEAHLKPENKNKKYGDRS